MDTAYDHIQEESFPDDPNQPENKDGSQQAPNFNAEFQEAYKAISASPWAARLGGLLGTVKKQGEQLYNEGRKEAAAASSTATKGIAEIISRTRTVSITQPERSQDASSSKEEHPDRPDSLPADIVKEAENLLSRFRSDAPSLLKNIQKAEDAADEALLKFGTNIRNFLRDAVTIAPPKDGGDDPSKVLFESKDSEGKRVIHTTRFDAQLHVIHSNLDSFIRDPVSPEWAKWTESFDIEAKTDAIAKDLEAHPELRKVMEKLVPERVEYKDFWRRYYFLRHVVESEEQKRREMLKASAAGPAEEEEVSWDADSDEDEEAEAFTPQQQKLGASKETIKAKDGAAGEELLKPTTDAQPRKSQDLHSQPDSDASYDLVSGATSRTPGSPKETKKETTPGTVEEESDDDWE